jgi:hypothetical protein
MGKIIVPVLVSVTVQPCSNSVDDIALLVISEGSLVYWRDQFISEL